MTISALCPKCAAKRLFVMRPVLDWFDVVCETCDERLMSLASQVRKSDAVDTVDQVDVSSR